jgi:diamine N-acetyltransferase
VTAATWQACRDLQVHEEQRAFVSPVADYLALAAHGGQGWVPLAVHRGEDVIGFVMWAVDAEDGTGWIGGLVIDRAAQGQGAGRAAVEAVLGIVAATGAPEAALSYGSENARARRLYASVGFRETGEVVDGELVARLRL